MTNKNAWINQLVREYKKADDSKKIGLANNEILDCLASLRKINDGTYKIKKW